MQTTHRIVPARSWSSTQSRTSRSSDPWCSAICPAHAGFALKIAWYQISVCDRVFVNTNAERPDSMAATTCGSSVKPRCPAHGKRSTFGGMTLSMTVSLGSRPRINFGTPPTPSSTLAAVAVLPSVADRPQTRKPGDHVRRRANASSVKTPRFDDSNSCHSSTTTDRRLANFSRASACVSSSDRLSGVVTSTVGSRSRCFLRADALVSPVRRPTSQFSPSGASGAASDAAVSLESARSGVSHNTRNGGGSTGWTSPKASSSGPK